LGYYLGRGDTLYRVQRGGPPQVIDPSDALASRLRPVGTLGAIIPVPSARSGSREVIGISCKGIGESIARSPMG